MKIISIKYTQFLCLSWKSCVVPKKDKCVSCKLSEAVHVICCTRAVQLIAVVQKKNIFFRKLRLFLKIKKRIWELYDSIKIHFKLIKIKKDSMIRTHLHAVLTNFHKKKTRKEQWRNEMSPLIRQCKIILIINDRIYKIVLISSYLYDCIHIADSRKRECLKRAPRSNIAR